MKNKKAVWLSKLAVITLCTAMAAEPAAIYAGSFTDGTAPAICEEEPQIQPPAIYEENPQIQQPAGEDFAPDGEESPEDSFSAGDEWDD